MSQPPGVRGGAVPTHGRGRANIRNEDHTELRRPRSLQQVLGTPVVPLPALQAPAMADLPVGRGSGETVEMSELSADAKEFYPKDNGSADPSSDGEGGAASEAMASGPPRRYPFDNYLTGTLEELTLNPGIYNSCVGPLTEILLQDVEDQERQKRVVDTIIEKAILFQNFRYSGVRLLCHFRNALPVPAQSDYRKLLLRSCQGQCQDVMQSLKAGVKLSVSRGFAVFLGELFMQLEMNSGEGDRLFILGAALFDVLIELLQTETADSVKCVCQTLKLAGMALDEQDTVRMDLIFQKLQVLLRKFANDNVAALINVVIKLRQNAWQPPVSLPDGPALSPPIPVAEEQPPFYLDNGDVLNPQEGEFLGDGIVPVEDFGLDSGSDVGAYGPAQLASSDEDMEDYEEFDAAYEEFLQYSNQKTT